jgi:hypothetical protein
MMTTRARRYRQRWTLQVLALGLVPVAAACGGREAETEGGMEGMEMRGPAASEGGETARGGLGEEMHAHLERMAGLPPDSLGTVLAAHRQRVANMLAQMNREMRQMNMAPDSAWSAAVEALRSDLVQMPGMSPEELAAFVPSHYERVERLLAMHAEMMRAMGM